ncbi:MAG: HDIG domain-containing metalloprotein [Patescibacteria group bacterium]|jgi:putative nucleotidyltransferase with HDIG domain
MDILELGIDYNQAQKLVDQYITDKITRLHLIESEAIMRALARHFKEDEEKWGIVGLLHDIDWDLTKNNTKEHCVRCVRILKEAGATDFLVNTIVSHGYGIESCGAGMDKSRSAKLEHCLVAAETLTGLIIATTLMQPDKKLASVRPESLKKKYKTKGFAAKCNRELIAECEKCGIPLDEFLNLGLKALQGISGELGM